MNEREKRLVLILGLVAASLLGLFGYKIYARNLDSVRAQKAAAQTVIDKCQAAIDAGDQLADQLEWLAANEPKPQAIQTVRPVFQQFATRRAEEAGLTVLSPSFPPSEESAGYYGRAKVRMTVTGTEAALYRWLNEMQSPKDFRTVASIDLTPLRDDDTKISCTVVLEQWFVPEPSPS